MTGSGLVLVTMHTLEVVPEFQKLKCFNVTLFFNDFLGLIIDVRIIFHLLEKYSHHFLFVIPRLAFAEVRLTVMELDLRQRLFVGFQISNHLFVFYLTVTLPRTGFLPAGSLLGRNFMQGIVQM